LSIWSSIYFIFLFHHISAIPEFKLILNTIKHQNMNQFKRLFFTRCYIILLCALFSHIGYTQVTSAKYMIRFNDTTQHFDAYVVIESGSATSIAQRTIFNGQYTIIVPSGSSISVAERFLPLLNNNNYEGTEPSQWTITNSISAPLSNPHSDYHAVIPVTFPSGRFNNVIAGDTLKLYSLEISPIPQCKQEVRIYENGVDPDSSDPSFMGGDFTNGFTMGSTLQLYSGNIVGNIIPIPTVSITGDDSICPSSSTTVSPNSGGEWTSFYPNIASINNAGIITGLTEGDARFIFRDSVTGCRSLPTDIITVLTQPSVFNTPAVCAGSNLTLSPNPYQEPFTASPNNPPGGTVVNNNGMFSFQFSDEAAGIFDFFPSGMGCLDTIRILVNPRPIVSFIGDQNICVGDVSQLSPIIGGSWISSNLSVSTVTNAGLATGFGVGTASFTYTSSSTGCVSLPSEALIVRKKPTILNVSTVCAGTTFTLSPNPFQGPFTPNPNNPPGGTVTENNGIYSFVFSSNAVGTFEFFSNSLFCPDVIRIPVVLRPVVTFPGDKTLCIGQTTNLTPTTGGSWVSNNTLVATVSNNGTVTATGPGSANFIYTSILSGCTSLPTEPVVVSPRPTVTVSKDSIDIGKTASLTPTTGGTWYSNDTTVIKIMNNALASGMMPGSTSIYFVSNTTECASRNVNMLVTDPMSSIVGFAFRDINGNGLFDSQTDSPLPNCAINIASLNSTFYTDKTGYYNLSLVPGVYELNFTLPYGNWTNNSITKTVNANSSIEYVFVGFKPEAEETNALVTINPSNLVCNNLENLGVTVFNSTSQLVSGYLGIHIDEKTFVNDSDPFPIGASDNVIFWEFIDLLPGHTFTPNIELDIPLPQMEGDSLFFEAFSISQSGDTLSTFIYADAINCGQTGQNMLNWPNRLGEENFTLREESLDYLIRFENPTSESIKTITVANTLDKNIDLSSILIKESSHTMTSYKVGDKIYFVFENINLGGNTGNNDGYVAFQCKFKEDVADGTIITNLAELTFDEKKETTNTTINTIVTNTPCVTQSKDVNVCPSVGYTIGQTTYFEAGTYGEILPGIGSCDTFQMVNVSLLSEPSNGLTQQGNLFVAEGEGNNYYWYECNNPNQIVATTTTYAPNQNGSYFVIVEGEFCSSKSACVDFFLSNNEDLLKENIKIFPNPTIDMLNIESNIAIDQISIKNILGAIQSINKTNTSIIDLGSFANGIYFIEIKTAQGTLISKVIKQ
jgi:hypothetical protein